LLFSAYGHGWGYAAVKLPATVVRDKLDAGAATRDSLLAAFEIHKERIAFAISRHRLPDHGERIQLDASDFQGNAFAAPTLDTLPSRLDPDGLGGL
jgi:hypothetical protein